MQSKEAIEEQLKLLKNELKKPNIIMSILRCLIYGHE